MKKIWINFWLGVSMLIAFLGLALTGLIMRYVLPHGYGYRGGEGLNNTFFWMTRPEWGSIHFTIALILIAVLIIHLLLHWNWIVGRLRELKSSSEKTSPTEP